MCDINGDGKDDIVGFGDSYVIVSLSNGITIEDYETWNSDFTQSIY